MTNENLNKAKCIKNDEFYTTFEDIEQELIYYKEHLKNKIVYCNCDNSNSNFWKYFHLNFSILHLKKLICTYYDENNPTYKLEYAGGNDLDITDYIKTKLIGNGDFQSQECLDFLDIADIIITNPPFSLFKDYLSVLIKHTKKFLIVGNKNAVTYKNIFPLLKDNKIWLGYNNINKFIQPDNTFRKFGNVGWYTNLDTQKRHKNINLWKSYNSTEYPMYDNYNAIEVSKVSEIPVDYDGVMGVPITFFEKYNPEQFEIVGTDEAEGVGFSNGLHHEENECKQCCVKGKKVYKRIFIRKKL